MSRQRPPAAILSPHLDDAVLSCWHVLAGPADVTVLNVCTAAPPAGAPAAFWDLINGGHDPARRMRERRAEDAAALGLAGRRGHELGFLDFQYTGAALAVADIVERVLAILVPETVLYVPIALGAHPDHLAARAAGLKLEQHGFRLAFYADLPHAVRPRWLTRLASAPASAGLSTGGLTPTTHRLDAPALAAKLAAVAEYRTQLAGLEAMLGGPVTEGDVLRHEVVWASGAVEVRPARAARRSGSRRAAGSRTSSR